MPLNFEEKEGMNSGIWLFGTFWGEKRPPCRTHEQPLTLPLNSKEIYAQPCFICHTFCNCDRKRKYPDVLVRTVDLKTVRLGGYFVSGSWTLQINLTEKQKKIEEEGTETNIGPGIEYPCEEDSTLNDKNSAMQRVKKSDGSNGDSEVLQNGTEAHVIGGDDGDETVPITELFEWSDNVVDLRNEDGSPDLMITSDVLDICQKFMAQHLDDVDEAVAAEIRAVKFFYHSLDYRAKPGPNKYFAYEDWEEDLFDVNGAMFSELCQAAQQDLRMPDLTFALEKWFALFRGRPADDTFGRALYNILPVTPKDRIIPFIYTCGRDKIQPDPVDTFGPYKDFYNRQWLNYRVSSAHGLPDRFRTVYFGHHKFPRRYQWKRGAAAGYNQEKGHIEYWLKASGDKASGDKWVNLSTFPKIRMQDFRRKEGYSLYSAVL